MNYLIGDIQGCDCALVELLETVGFSPSSDHLYALGDLVNRGPSSMQVLDRFMKMDGAASSLLGNHDLHLLAVAAGARKVHRGDTLSEILASPHRQQVINWVRTQPLAIHAHGWLMVHAGVLPQWDLATTLTLAGEVESVLRGPRHEEFLSLMYANEPTTWDEGLTGTRRLRGIVNGLTRLRYCDSNGHMDFQIKEGVVDSAPPGLLPWFDVPGRRTVGTRIAFGHWSTLGQIVRPDLLALDTGCVWGGSLTAAAIDAHGTLRDLIAVRCPQAQQPH